MDITVQKTLFITHLKKSQSWWISTSVSVANAKVVSDSLYKVLYLSVIQQQLHLPLDFITGLKSLRGCKMCTEIQMEMKRLKSWFNPVKVKLHFSCSVNCKMRSLLRNVGNKVIAYAATPTVYTDVCYILLESFIRKVRGLVHTFYKLALINAIISKHAHKYNKLMW